jgi:uncharacterized protein (TIGR02246 family)
MRNLSSMLLLLLTAISAGRSLAQSEASAGAKPETSSEGSKLAPELAAIRAGSEAFVAAFNKKDAKAVAALWTEDGEYIDDSGHAFLGREAIETGYAAFFAANPDATLQLMIDSMKLLSSDSAIEDGQTLVTLTPQGNQDVGKYTVVHVKVNGKWFMASVRDARIETASAQQSIADLEFLIGTWIAEEHGIKSESVCRWVADKRFVQRTYTTTFLDGTQTSGVQMIGWNAERGHVQSWDFSPDGGHALGIWSPAENGWTSEIQGVRGDGTLTSSVNFLRRLDDNAYVWQSIQRNVGGIALPDTDEVVLKRQQ